MFTDNWDNKHDLTSTPTRYAKYCADIIASRKVTSCCNELKCTAAEIVCFVNNDTDIFSLKHKKYPQEQEGSLH